MRTAHVNEQAITLRYDFSENLNHQEWEVLLDQLRSRHLPGLYQAGKRAHAALEAGTGKTCVTIYLTPQTVSMDDAVAILHQFNFEVHDSRDGSR